MTSKADLARLAPLLGRRHSWWPREAIAAEPWRSVPCAGWTLTRVPGRMGYDLGPD